MILASLFFRRLIMHREVTTKLMPITIPIAIKAIVISGSPTIYVLEFSSIPVKSTLVFEMAMPPFFLPRLITSRSSASA